MGPGPPNRQRTHLEHDGEDFDETSFQSLCRFGFSNKRRLHTIGFRGVGFKSTFSLGPRVEVWSPTLAVAFHQRRFTEPEWVGGARAEAPRHTTIRIAIDHPDKLRQMQGELARWAETPVPLLFFRSVQRLELQGETISKSAPQGGPVPGSLWVDLHGRETERVLHVVSDEAEFPADALEEVRRERGEADFELPPCCVELVLGIGGELIIGLGTVELSGSRVEKRQRFVGITTVFRGDGNYLLGNISRDCSYADYPEVLRQETTTLLRDIKARNGWQSGDTVRIVFHSFKPLRKVEIADVVAECVREVGEEQNVEFAFLTISEEHPFAVLDKAQRGTTRNSVTKGQYVPERGTFVQQGRYTRLLATNGPALLKRAESPLPRPLLIRLHKESTYRDLGYLSEQVLKFTSLSWRSVLPANRPVSVYYSELIAGLLARLRNVRDWSPATLNIKLRASRWFL